MGVVQSELEKLLARQAGVGVAKKLGVRSRMNLQRFTAGEVSMTMAYALGMLATPGTGVAGPGEG